MKNDPFIKNKVHQLCDNLLLKALGEIEFHLCCMLKWCYQSTMHNKFTNKHKKSLHSTLRSVNQYVKTA